MNTTLETTNFLRSLTPPAARRRVILLGALALLAACGGGGGGSPANGGGGAGGGGAGGGGGGAGGGGGGGGGAPPPAFSVLWVPHYNRGELRGLRNATVGRDLDGPADVTITLPAGTRPNALARQPDGGIWVTDNANDRLLLLTANQYAVTGAPTPAVTIQSDGASLRQPIGLCFDRDSNLWVAVQGRLEMYVPTDLDDSGPTTPTRVLRAANLQYPADITFDAAGNLWLTNASFTVAENAIVVFTPAQLAAGGLQVPQLRIESPSFALIEGMRFDRAGDLWVASNDGFSVARFAAADLVVPAIPTIRPLQPAGSLEADADDTPTGRSVRKPGGLVFDRDGNLWLNSQRGAMGTDVSSVLMFRAAQLAGLNAGRQLSADVVVARTTSNPGFGGMLLQVE